MAHIELSHDAQIAASLADPLRIRILRLVLERELCVCELMQVIKEPQYKVSRHLAVLKRAGLLHDWREGTWIHYEINPSLPLEWRRVLYEMRAVWDRSSRVQEDLRRLRHSSKRRPGVPVACCTA